MTRPVYKVDRRVAAPPETVLTAIRDGIRATRTSDIPRELRETFVPVLRGKVSRQRFAIHLDGMDERSHDLAGYVLPAEDGGSRVVADVGVGRPPERMPLALLAVAAVMAVAGLEGWVTLAVVAAVAWLAGVAGKRFARVPAREAEFLLSWLDRVLDGLPAEAVRAGDEHFPFR